MYLLDLVYPEAAELLEIEKGEMATSVYGLPVYFRVRGADDADAFHDGAAHAIQISIRYLDIGTDPIVLAYSTDGSTETTQTIVTKGNTGKWKWKHKTISSNARFDHSVYLNFDYADFALTCDSELLLSNVTLRETALNTEAVWKAAEERVTATAGEAAIDTTLFSGWTVSETYLARDTGTDNTSAGLAPDDYPFYAGATYANRASAPFRVTPAGALVATSATITGAITATSGTIGGFTVGSDYVRDAANSFGLASTVTGGDDVRFWAGAAFASRASAPFRVTEAGVLTTTSGAIGGWTIGASTISNGSISLDSSVPALKIGSATAYLTGSGIFAGLSGGAYKFHIGNPSGNYLSWDGTNLAASGQWITGGGMNPSLQSWKTNIVFSSASATQVNWTSGTIRLNDGTTYSINSGNTGAMAALTYIYLDTAVSTTVLQTTTTYSTAVGSGKILIAAAQNNTTAASVIPMGGQQPIIDGGAQIAALSIVAASIAAATITGAKIAAGTITASNIVSGTITATQLSATAIDSMTITGATIRTASSGARTEMNASNLFGLGFGGIGGYGGSTVQWYAKNSDGKLYAGGGKVVADSTGFYATDGTNRVFTIASTAYTLNGESLAVGDIILGNNATSTANLKIASGALVTRTDTTQYIHLSGRQLYTENDAGFSTEVLTVTGATGTNQDLDANGFGSGAATFYTNFVRVTSTGNWTLRSIVTGVDGQWLFLINESANNMTIANAGAAPAGYSAIRTFDGSSPATANAGCALFIYNQTNNTWDLMSYRG